MGIYLMKSGTIECDECSKLLANITASREVVENLSQHPMKITCVECKPVEKSVSNPPTIR